MYPFLSSLSYHLSAVDPRPLTSTHHLWGMSVPCTYPTPGCASTHERIAPIVSVNVYMPKCPVRPLRSKRTVESINLRPWATVWSDFAPSARQQRAVERGSNKAGGLGHVAQQFSSQHLPPEAPQTLDISSRRPCYSALPEELTGMSPPAQRSLPHHHHDLVGLPPPSSPLSGDHQPHRQRQGMGKS